MDGHQDECRVVSGESLVLPESANWTFSLTFDDADERLVGAGFDGSLATWDAGTGDPLDVFSTGELATWASGTASGLPRQLVVDVESRPGTTEVGWARRDGLIGAWDVESGAGLVLHHLERPRVGRRHRSHVQRTRELTERECERFVRARC